MSHNKFSLLLAGVVLMAILAIPLFVFAISESSPQLKILSRDAQTIESAVNDWLGSQKNITIDQIKANAYGGDYAVIVHYRTGGGGRVSTRIKIVNSNALTGSAGDNSKTLEMRAQELVSSFALAHTIRSADIFAGSGPWDIFIVYDENPIQSVISEAATALSAGVPFNNQMGRFLLLFFVFALLYVVRKILRRWENTT